MKGEKEMSKKKKIIVVLSVFVLLIGGMLLYCRRKLELIKVPVATYSLGKRALVDESTYKLISVPKRYLNSEVVVDREDLNNKCVRIDGFVPKGSFFYKSVLDDIGIIEDKLTYDLREDEVAYDININDLKVNQAYLKEGMYVDIYLTISKDRVLSDLLISNVRIIGLYDLNHKKILDFDNSAVLHNIILALPNDAVSYINKALAIGSLNAVIGKDCYQDVGSKLNDESMVFNYLR